MAKFYGPVGYAETVETEPGMWEDQIIERNYTAELVRNSSKWAVSSDSINDNLSVNVQISILADPYAIKHYHRIKYVEFEGVKWKVASTEPRRPRIILTLGGEYNG